MIFDIFTIACLVGSHIFAGTAPVLIYKSLKDKPNNVQFERKNRPESELAVLEKYSETPYNVTEVISTIDDVTFITEEEHMKHLVKLYPDAFKEYVERHSKKPLMARADRYILRMIMAVEAGELDISISQYHLKFGNGDKIWIANKYYGYGHLSDSPDNPQCIFNHDSHRTSPYTFMRIVHLEETFFDPILRLKHSTFKVV